MAKKLTEINYARLTSAISVGLGTGDTKSLTVAYAVGVRTGAGQASVYHDLPGWCLGGTGTASVTGPGTTTVDAGLNALAAAIETAESLVAGDQIVNSDGNVLVQL